MSEYLDPSGGGRFWPEFRSEEIGCINRWLELGGSGAIVGLAGSGKSNLLNYIAQQPSLMKIPRQAHFLALVPIDLNLLIFPRPVLLCRLILRSCARHRDRFAKPLPALIDTLYATCQASDDLFVNQTAVQDLLLAVQQQRGRVVFLLDQFDRFCHSATPELTLLLRGWRDSCKETLSYIVGLRQSVIYLPRKEALGALYQLLDMHVCWVGAMNQDDAREFVRQELRRGDKGSMPEAEIRSLIELTGGYASLLKVACSWWLGAPERPSPTRWRGLLGKLPTMKSRLEDIWQGLTQEERWALANINERDEPGMTNVAPELLSNLSQKGLCILDEGGWRLNGGLLTDFRQTAVRQGLGRIWQDEKSGQLYQGKERIVGLRPLEEALLIFLLRNAYTPHSKTKIIEQVWPDGTRREGVTDDSLYQTVRGVRRKIEPGAGEAPVYLLTKRGVAEGGYQFFPEGHPAVIQSED